jgi:DNA mismatch repair protein MutS2
MEAGRIWGRGIEWDAVRGLLAQQARTAMGREQALGVEPFTELATIRSAIDATRQARSALAEVGAPPIDTVPDVRPVLDRARVPGSVLDGTDLIVVLPFLDATPRLLAYARTIGSTAPTVVTLTQALPRADDLRDALRAALDDEGGVKDDASPRLRHLRRDLRERRRRIVADLERLFQGSDADRIFGDRFVTVRHGRYVVPVRAEARQRLRGIVHDRSQSGQTLFVEPESSVDANNDLVQLAREEEQETARILGELSDAVRARLDDLDRMVGLIAALDALFARAHLAERMSATAPVIDPDRGVALRDARHPLLLAQRWHTGGDVSSIIPVDIELNDERPLVVITGPNAGGKTIALKTLALHALMAQIGCHVPAAEGSRLPVFERLYAIIGDDQSVAENLSTFSAFVKQVREILAEADERSLVLLDELGAGTDPDEGAALAQAILESLAERGALVMATTHLEPLKAFASTHPRARNASVEFDTATLAPTFRLRYDRPGQSYALTIAARLGLEPELIARAERHRSLHAARLSELLQSLDEHTRSEAERTIAIERREQEATARLAQAREAEAVATTKARDLVERAKRDAAALLADIKRTVAVEWDRLKRSERSRRDLSDTRRRLNEAVARVTPPPEPVSDIDLPTLAPGMIVSAAHLGLRGRLVTIAGGTATVEAGSVTVRVPLSALRPAEEQAAGDERKASGRAEHRRVSAARDVERSVNAELMLIGRRADEARDMVEKYLDDAFMAGLPTVRLVHGKGTGTLRKTVRDVLSSHPLVDSFRDGEPSEGGTGATVAALKVG